MQFHARARYRWAALAAALGSVSLAGADWPQFRGSGATSVAADTKLPIEWSPDRNFAWQVELPGRGPASPIVVRDRVIVTASSGPQQDRLHVLAFDAASGRRLWERQFWATGRTLTHPSSANAAPTPASDGRFVYAFFSSNDLICLDLDGDLQWYRGLGADYPKTGNDVGMSSSPLVVGDTVVVQVECQGDSFAAGLDTATGANRWRLKRPQQANWASPISLKTADGESLVLLQSPSGVSAHDPRTGDEQWRVNAECSAIPSAAADGRRVFFAAQGLTAIEFGGASAEPRVLWSSARLSPASPSPVVHNGRVYTMSRAGVLSCGEAETGESLWQLRLKGQFWATPVIADGHAFCVNSDGLVQVVRLTGEAEQVGSYEMGETVQGSPAVGAGGLFLRSDRHLWKISASK